MGMFICVTFTKSEEHHTDSFIIFLMPIKCNLLFKCFDIDILGGNVQDGEP